MDIEAFRNYCLSKPAAAEGFPFGEDTLVFKVMNKMFAATSLTRQPFSINLKCDPEYASQLREEYDGIIPGYHMNKKHWNTIIMESGLRDDLIKELIDHSYDLVVSGLKKSDRDNLSKL